MTIRYLIDDPEPFSPKSAWEAFLVELLGLDQSSIDVQRAVVEAKGRIDTYPE